MIADGIAPMKTKFEREKEYLRNANHSAASHSGSVEEFQQELLSKYNIQLKISRGRYSHLHPNRTKPITVRNLGTHYEKDYLLERFTENIKAQTKENQQTNRDNIYKKPVSSPKQQPSSRQGSSPKPDYHSIDEQWKAILFIKSDLRLVINLQDCIKTQESTAYDFFWSILLTVSFPH